jgi:adenylate cyclase
MKGLQILLCTLGAAAVVVLLSVVRPDAIAQLDRRAYDELQRRTARPPATGRVSIVAVDEKSIAEIGQWPWRRDVVAQLVERLRDLGARVIAFDIILSEPDRLGLPQSRTGNASTVTTTTTDATLAAAIERQRVVTGYAFTFDAPAAKAADCVLHPLQTVQAAPARYQHTSESSSAASRFQPGGGAGFLNAAVTPTASPTYAADDGAGNSIRRSGAAVQQIRGTPGDRGAA